MYQYSEIKALHLEISSKCNAACPMCARNICGGAVNPHLPLTELSLEDIKTIMPLDFIKQLKRIYMCGNYGDPIIAKDTLEIFKWFRKNNPALSLSMFTNGSAQKPLWWKQLGSVVNKVHFSIDGLESTNSIYRRGTQFNKILTNLSSFIEGGGEAVWDYIVFRHNEHQVEEAKVLAKKLGVQKFVVKKQDGFIAIKNLK